MGKLLRIEKYSVGVGDRFARQAKAQLRACMKAAEKGAEVIPVWNKSHREHATIGSEPSTTRAAAEAAVKDLRWHKPYHVDADHIRLETVDRFVPHSDFFTIDVADFIGRPSDASEGFVGRHGELEGKIQVANIERPLEISRSEIARVAGQYLFAVQQAGRIYRHIERAIGRGSFITEVSMDETDSPQTPRELLVILAAIADERIPVQTIAPKFTGRFNKGVDYSGDLAQFEREFNADLSVIAFAIREFGLPDTLKLSVHSGSDKFSLYPTINRLIKKHGAGLHVKTAGTTWLEEIIGLAESGGEGLAIAKELYARSFERLVELTAPYRAVVDIDQGKLLNPKGVAGWSSTEYVCALQHAQSRPGYNPHFRQLLHIGFKIAAEMGERFTDALRANEPIVSRHVTENLFQRHLLPIFA